MAAYYNEIDPYAAKWLRNLIDAGHIAPGIVDERSIEDVHPDELRGFTQCHFFAGVGVWSYALRRAGWPDDRPVWTGSCPCQPFSAAGAGAGFDDKRHLWPHFHWLIQECRPAIVLGEQVASKDANPWIDLVQADLEAMGYAFGAVAFPAASVGAPHIRDRLYWLAHTGGPRGSARLPAAARRHQGVTGVTDYSSGQCTSLQQRPENFGFDSGSRLGHANGNATGGITGNVCGTLDRENGQHNTNNARTSGADGRLADPKQHRRGCETSPSNHIRPQTDRPPDQHGGHCGAPSARPSPTNGYWRDADWLLCRDGKWRPVEPGTFPLAHGTSNRVGYLRAYGNAICAPQAQLFIEAAMNCLP